MTKTEKRLEKELIKLLTLACENLKALSPHFCYLSHTGSMKKLSTTLNVQLYCSEPLTKSELNQALELLNNHLKALSCSLKASQINVKIDSTN
ncbi:hypothetical protein [Pseudoalteromonas byunsanensis]|uniref:Uncharacterized protein n=1 Tax=Pseudoalteromonas byunsanensis TaxID=327939 RepID=A0A1S1N577_9GAMM|nr:hypothetical protein [Pseudoalteromonas byunsanensis]OHU94575.1 hypothetical protein BIW53_16070 [Pseudoalteromonas byunsanensis]